MHRTTVCLVLLAFSNCSKKPLTPLEFCALLAKDGLAAGCRETKPRGLAANARRAAEFDLPSVPGKTGAIWWFETAEALEATVQSYDAARVLAGPHRYANRGQRLFVQINDGLSMDDGDRVKKLLEGL